MGVAERVFFFDLGIHPEMKDPIEQTKREDSATTGIILDEIRRINDRKIFEVWGWLPVKYMIYGCGDDKDPVRCGEWYWVKRISEKGGVQRFGGGENYAREPANLSFYKHFKGIKDIIPQPSPLKVKDLFKKNYLLGYPQNFSFENNFGGDPWILDTTNRTIYEEEWNAAEGKRFLQVNVSAEDLNKHNSFYQDFSLPLLKGYRYRFEIKMRSPEGVKLKGKQVVWAWGNDNQAVVLCHNQFERDNKNYQPLYCDFDVTGNKC